MRTLSLSLLALLAASALAFQKPTPQAPGVVETKPLDPADQVKQFVLPPGFEAQLVASDPDIRKPLNLNFDDLGRLWVTDTIEYPHPPKQGKPRDSVKILSDFGPNGKARSIQTFADGLNIPIGVLPLTGSREALVHSIPSVFHLRDTKGNSFADRRDAAVTGYGFEDTHGMTSSFTVGFDGLVYATHGFRNTSKLQGKDGSRLVMNSGNTYRFRPDGAKLEQHTWGQVNPFGLTLDPWGNLYSADCHSQPIYQLIRGAYYPSFGKPHDGLGFGPEMITNYRGSTAVCGIAYYAADAFPKKYQGHAYVGDVMTNQIVLFELSWTGTTPKAKQTVFMESKDRWWRPVDIKLGPDGALYVADFYNCIIGHYEVEINHPKRDRHRGRIWRIAYKGKEQKGTPAPRTDYTKASVKELVSDLGHPNLSVRMMAQRQLVQRGQVSLQAVQPALKDANKERRVHSIWVLEQLGSLGDEALLVTTKDAESIVRAHSMRVLSERATLTAKLRERALAGLKDDEPHVRRAAADALGRHPNSENVRPLLELLRETKKEDDHLVHTVRIALRNQLRQAECWKQAETWNGSERRTVADLALAVQTPEAASYLVKHLRSEKPTPERRAASLRHIARYGQKETLADLLTWSREAVKSEPNAAHPLLDGIKRGSEERGGPLPAGTRAWANELVTARLAGSRDEARSGLDLVALLRLDEHESTVEVFALNRGRDGDHNRAAALRALAAIDAKKHAGTFGKFLADAELPAGDREQAAALLAQTNQNETRKLLVAALPLVSSPLQTRIASGLALSREGCVELLAAVESGKASPRLLTDREVNLRVNRSGIPGVKEKVEKLTAGLPSLDAKLAKLLAERSKTHASAKRDVDKGAKLFEKHCANCHQIAGKGAKFAPQLDGIGLRGLDRLLEDTLDPNRNVDAAFRQTTMHTKKGQVIAGLVVREEGEVVVMADQQGKEVRVPRKEIEKREPSTLSPMPANFGETIPEAEFHDLLAYLLALKPEKK